MIAAQRILYIDHTARLSGGELALLNLITALDRSQYEPVVLLFSDGPLRQKLADAGVETHVLPLASAVIDVRKDTIGFGSLFRVFALARAVRSVRQVTRKIEQLRPALVHTNSLKADLIGGLAARRARVPLIWHVRDRIVPDYLSHTAVVLFRWLSLRVPDFVIANSQSTLATLPKRVRGRAIPSGVVIRPLVRNTDHAEGGGDMPDAGRRLVVGMVGRLARWKGQHVFIDAIRRLRPDFPRVRFQIIGSALFGEDAYERKLRTLVARYGLQEAVEFTGFREDVFAAIDGLDVVVHASITGEPFGQVVLEAMSAGKPVVATRGGGVVEIVQEGVTGLLVPMNDGVAMAAALKTLLSDAKLRADLGRRGREQAEAVFTIGHTAAMVQEVYRICLAPQATVAPAESIGRRA